MLNRGLRLAGLLLVWVVGIASAQILNSERIEQTFGSYGIHVVHSDDRLRVSVLSSRHGDREIPRTIAIAGYPRQVDSRYAGEHAAIVAGGSIGATFQSAGWEVLKQNLEIRELSAPAALSDAMQIEADTPLAVHAYRLDVQKTGANLAYATIIEMHHPDYLSTDELYEIYGAVTSADNEALWASYALLAQGLRTIDDLAGELTNF